MSQIPFRNIDQGHLSIAKRRTIKMRQKKSFPFLYVIAFLLLIGLFFILTRNDNDLSKQKVLSSNTANPAVQEQKIKPQQNQTAKSDGFLGDKGTGVTDSDGKIYIDEIAVADSNMHSFNYFDPTHTKTIYFFIVKASDGSYRAAANACEVCFGAKKGFKQIGNLIRCENCRVTYSKDQVSVEKGGCNPGPIDRNVTISDGKLVLDTVKVEAVSYLF